MILLTCTFFELKEDPADWARKFKLGSPTQEGNGSRIWILPPEKLLALTQSTNFPVISAPRMQTLDRLPSHLAVGRTNGVLSVDLSPRMRTDEVDLTAIIRTTHLASNHGEDFTTAFEAQLPYGSVVLVVDARPRGAMTERLGELLTAEEIDRTGRSVKHSKSNSQ
jgi:hypothetical protein